MGNLHSPGIRSPDRPIRRESLYRLSYSGPQLIAALKGQSFVFVLSPGNLPFSYVCDKDIWHKMERRWSGGLNCEGSERRLSLLSQATVIKFI